MFPILKMLPLIDGAGYKLFDAKMLSLTDGARNKLFGANMLASPSSWRWGLFSEGRMVIKEGYFYHISNDYFRDANDPSLMSNYEGGGYRPHFLAVSDPSNPDIYWMVPVSSKYAKYKALHDRILFKYRRCTKIVLGKCDGRDAAYLVQNPSHCRLF